MFKLSVAPFDCLLALHDNGQETRRPHSFMAQIDPGTAIRVDGRDWAVVEIRDRLDEVPVVVCRPS